MARTAFQLSRIYAEGWNAAHAGIARESSELDAKKMEALNPYPADPERARWNEGFTNAFRK